MDCVRMWMVVYLFERLYEYHVSVFMDMHVYKYKWISETINTANHSNQQRRDIYWLNWTHNPHQQNSVDVRAYSVSIQELPNPKYCEL